MAYAVVRTDNMFGTDVRSGLVSLKYMKGGKTATQIENGNVLTISKLIDGEREIYSADDVKANDDIDKVVLVATPELIYDPRHRALNSFVNEAGNICRAYHIHHGDVFSVTKEALAGLESPKAGNIVELAAGTKLNVAESATGESTQVGEIIAVEMVNGLTFYVIRVN